MGTREKLLALRQKRALAAQTTPAPSGNSDVSAQLAPVVALPSASSDLVRPVCPVRPFASLTALSAKSDTTDVSAQLAPGIRPALPTAKLSTPTFSLRKAPQLFSAEERALRDEKVLFVRLVLELLENAPQLNQQQACEAIAVSDCDRMPRLAKSHSLKYGNFRNWLNGHRDKPGLRDPLTGKVDFARADVLLRNYAPGNAVKHDERFIVMLKAAYYNTNQTKLSKIYADVVKKFTLACPDAAIPSLASVRYLLKKDPERLTLFARRGETYYEQHCRASIARDPESISVGEVFVADTQDCDFFVKVEDENGNFKAVRPKIITIMDVKSHYIVSCQLSVEGTNNEIIRNGLAAACWFYGRPSIFYIDNGADYKKMGFTTPVVFTPGTANSAVYEHCILKELDIELRTAKPYNGRAKFVERFFREMAEMTRIARGYVGNKPENRPASADVWAGKDGVSSLMSVFDATNFIDDCIEKYHSTPSKNSKFLKGLSPAQAWDTRKMRPQLSYVEYYMAFLMPEKTTRKLQASSSSVKVDNVLYVAAPECRTNLWQYDNQEVMVKFDLFSRDYCYIFSLKGDYIGRCIKQVMVPYFVSTESEKALLTSQLAEQADEKKALKTMLRVETKGWYKLDPQSILALPPAAFDEEADLRKLASKTSVKGDTHNPTIYLTKEEYNRVLPVTQNSQNPQKVKTIYAKKPVLPATQFLQLAAEIDALLLDKKSEEILPEIPLELPELDNKTTIDTGVKLDENFI